MEIICRNDYMALVRSILGKGEAVVLTDSRFRDYRLQRKGIPSESLKSAAAPLLSDLVPRPSSCRRHDTSLTPYKRNEVERSVG
ncbi:MAG: hypothetical protein K6A94_10470 [Bacteroidales bacterium]|nr:hypothetical protein [Bacteroidales bacterium]